MCIQQVGRFFLIPVVLTIEHPTISLFVHILFMGLPADEITAFGKIDLVMNPIA